MNTPETELLEQLDRLTFNVQSKAFIKLVADKAAERIRVLEKERDEARGAHKRQRENYKALYDAVVGEGCVAGMPDPFEIAKDNRLKAEKLSQTEKAGEEINFALVSAKNALEIECPHLYQYTIVDCKKALTAWQNLTNGMKV